MNRAIAAANQISPILRPHTPSSRVQHLKNVKRNLGLDEQMIYCPVCVYPATKHANNKGWKIKINSPEIINEKIYNSIMKFYKVVLTPPLTYF